MKPTKYIALALALVLTLTLAACGGSTGPSSAAAPTTSTPTPASGSASTEPAPTDFNALVAEEIERMRSEEEVRFAALPKIVDIENGTYEIIEFGGYDWRVLDVVDDRVLLLSDKILFDAICNEYFPSILEVGIPWANWELRAYLNGEFYNSFSEADRAQIVTVSNPNRENYNNEIGAGQDTQDNIFLLSVEEVVQYFGGEYDVANNKVAEDITYNANRVATHLTGGTYTTYDWNNNPVQYTVEAGAAHTWLLRSPGVYTEGSTFVDEEGYIDTYGQPVTFSEGIRPALWMRYEASADIPMRTVTVLPSATNEVERLASGDSASTGAEPMELLLNSQSTLKMDANTTVTVEQAGVYSLVLSVDSGAVLTSIDNLRGDERYEITAGDITGSVREATFVVENNETPRIIMFDGSIRVNGSVELSTGNVARIEDGRVVMELITVDESLSSVALESILAYRDNLSIAESDFEIAQGLLDTRGWQSASGAPQGAPPAQSGSNTRPPERPQGQDGFEVMTDKSAYQPGETMQVRVRGVTSEMIRLSAFVGVYVPTYEDHEDYMVFNFPQEGESTLTLTAPDSPGEYMVCLFSAMFAENNPVLLASYSFQVE